MALTRDQILQVSDLVKELIPVPEWGGEVWVRGMTGTERDKFEATIVSMKGSKTSVNMSDIRSRIASLSICDEAGIALFSEKDIRDLGKKSAVALQRIFLVAQRLSGIGEQDVKEMVDNLEEVPLEDSVSDSL